MPTLLCENCATALAGPFCHACGQAAETPTRSVRAFVAQAFGDLTNLDSRILRTFGTLLARPGMLTREYLDGRRVRYTQPLQVYLGAAAAFFFVNAFHPFLTFDTRKASVTSTLSAAGVSGTMDAATRASLAERGISVELFRERFEAAVTGYLPTFLVGSVVLFGVVLWIFFLRPRRGLIEHLIFSLHWSAFFLLLMIVDRLLPDGIPRSGATPTGVAIAVAQVAYLAMALRRAYGQSWPATLIKTLIFFAAYQMLISLWMVSAIALAFERLT